MQIVIETKHSIGEKVFVLVHNHIYEVTVTGHRIDCIQDTPTKYRNQIMVVFKYKNPGAGGDQMHENLLFKTREELIKSL